MLTKVMIWGVFQIPYFCFLLVVGIAAAHPVAWSVHTIRTYYSVIIVRLQLPACCCYRPIRRSVSMKFGVQSKSTQFGRHPYLHCSLWHRSMWSIFHQAEGCGSESPKKACWHAYCKTRPDVVVHPCTFSIPHTTTYQGMQNMFSVILSSKKV